jgi:hypothetical protein
MGGFIVQKYLQTAEAAVGVSLASIPQTRGLAFGPTSDDATPGSFLTTLFSVVPRVTREMLFTSDPRDQIVEDCHSRLGSLEQAAGAIETAIARLGSNSISRCSTRRSLSMSRRRSF